MALIDLKNLDFFYPGVTEPALKQVSLSVDSARFVVICGQSGCGKTTLVRNLKREIAPHGHLQGRMLYRGQDMFDPGLQIPAAEIGFVMQDPENQIVTDTVWHELAFGLENMGLPSQIIRRRVAETAHFFGINTWFDRSVLSLSGGQKQVLNLAAVMAMQPGLIILDEPVAQLDPIAAKEFLSVLKRIHLELGKTVILTEHMLDDIFPLADQVVYMERGEIKFDGSPEQFALAAVSRHDHPYLRALPSAVQIAYQLGEKAQLPLTVNEGRTWLKRYLRERSRPQAAEPPAGLTEPAAGPTEPPDRPLLLARDIWFRYNQQDAFVLRGFSCQVNRGQIMAIVGGNGSGKSTALQILAGLSRPQRGQVKWQDKKISKKDEAIRLAMLPQNPKALFIADTVFDDLMATRMQLGQTAEPEVLAMAEKLRISHLLTRHPYDLSGGEQQKAALGKLFLLRPQLMLLDEPTKGLDVYAKEELAVILRRHCSQDGAVVIVTHDLEFAARYADVCAMIFNGEVTCSDTARRFFAGNTFYTTSANRMSRGLIADAVTDEDVILACKPV